ncbi:MAG: hypothetical protein F4X40_08560 [Chloroflexi bacterium]|nr:hypothetical protein [Chloroflexota bacterium]
MGGNVTFGAGRNGNAEKGHIVSPIQKPATDVTLQQWSDFFRELQSESDRGVAIITGAWIESLIERKLKTMFTKGNSRSRKQLFENQAFSNFHSKALAAHCLGWIDTEIFHDIDLVRKIRNKFAHEFHSINFERSEIKELVDKFKIIGRQVDPDGTVMLRLGQYHMTPDDHEAELTMSGPDGMTSVTIPLWEVPTDNGTKEKQRLKYQCAVSMLIAETIVRLHLDIQMRKP